ncbi:MAG: UGMP family protein [Candidatus Micrarchaeota archaeon]
MRILGIESTAHTFGVGIYDSDLDQMLANPKAFYKAPPGQGMIPRVVAEHHGEHGARIVKQAMEEAGRNLAEKDAVENAGPLGFDSLDAIAYSSGPGLGPCLQTGLAAASFLARKHGLPLVPVNHCHAHIEVGRWQCGFDDPLALYVSGGNTQIITGTKRGGIRKTRIGASEPIVPRGSIRRASRDVKLKGGWNPPCGSVYGPPFRVLGETLDIGVGNLFDAFARELKMPFAHGSMVAKKAMEGKNYHPLPYTIKGMNFTFSGLLTSAGKMIGQVDENDLCFSLMETAFAQLAEGAERALMLTEKKEVLLCGGVAQNTVLIDKIKMMAALHGAKAGTCENQYNADNGAMIALTGARRLAQGKTIRAQDAQFDQKFRIDMVE